MNVIRRLAVILIVAFTGAFALPLLAQTPAAATESWVIDKPHSSVGFEIRHLVGKVPGYFRDVDAMMQVDRAQPARSSIEFTIKAASIDTRDAERDEHLRSPDFFEASKYPLITFKSTSITPKSKERFDVTGDLTMHGVTKRITLPVELTGPQPGPRGREIAGFDIETTLDRKDYNITWNRLLDEGGLLLGDEVKVRITLRMEKK